MMSVPFESSFNAESISGILLLQKTTTVRPSVSRNTVRLREYELQKIWYDIKSHDEQQQQHNGRQLHSLGKARAPRNRQYYIENDII